jgi:hypothetical protein
VELSDRATGFRTLQECSINNPDARAQAPRNRDLGPVLAPMGQGAGTVWGADQQNLYDGVSGNYYTLLASAVLNSISATVLTLGPGSTTATNTVANDYVPYL